MNTLLVFSAICIGFASAGASHAHHARDNSNSYVGSSSQQRQLVDVPYTVEYRNSGAGSSQSSGGNSFGRAYQQPSYQASSGNSFGRSYQQQQPQFEVQRSEPIYQNSYSQPQPQTQAKQYVDVPYTVEQRKVQAAPAPVVQQRSFVQPQQQFVQVPAYTPPVVQQQRTYSPPQQSIRTQPQQQQHQLVDIPYTVEIRNVAKPSTKSVSRSYPHPKPQVQRAPVVQQRTYSPPAQSAPRQSKQLIDIPYTVETRGGNSNADSGYRFIPYSAGNSLQIQAPQQQKTSGVQYVDVPYQVIGGAAKSAGGASDNFRFLPYSLGDSLQIASIGGGVSSGGYQW